MTDYNFDFSSLKIDKDDIAVIAVPAYEGRVPNTASNIYIKYKGMMPKQLLYAFMEIGYMMIL